MPTPAETAQISPAPTPAAPRAKRPSRGLHRWHQRAGLAAALFLLFLLVTGVPLQFSGALSLGQRYVTAEAILDWYGLVPPDDVQASGGLVSVGDRLYAAGGRQPVATLTGFRGAVTVDGLAAAAGAGEVLLMAASGGEILDRFSLQTRIDRIGLHEGRVALDTPTGVVKADAALVNWVPATVPGEKVAWAALRRPADAAHYRQQFRQRMLTVERLLQDAHSGRLLGTPGIVVVDVASALLLFLAVSGVIMWWRIYRR